MKNIINFFYNMNAIDIYIVNEKYYFNYKNNDYFFIVYNRLIEDVQNIYSIYIELTKRNILTNDIILNKDNQIITFINNIPYVLIRDNIKHKRININDILYIQNNTLNIINKKKYKSDWLKLWKTKIDYYEETMNDISKTYTILSSTIDYYIGLGENAISYLVNNNVIDNNICLSHRRIEIDKSSFDFYNPINYIIDNRVRDFSEYIKNLFFLDRINMDTLKNYLNYINFSKNEYILFIARLLFPTYYFDMYDNIINYNLKEDMINRIVNKTDEYILFIKQIFMYILYQKKISIPIIEWIIRFND